MSDRTSDGWTGGVRGSATGGVFGGLRAGPWDATERAEWAVGALGRADDAATAALRLLVEADDVRWVGAGAAAYRDRLADLLAGARRLGVRLREAEVAVVRHAAAVRDAETWDRAAAQADGWRPVVPGLVPDPWVRGRVGHGDVVGMWSGRGEGGGGSGAERGMSGG